MTSQPSPQAIAAITEVLQLASLLDHRVPTPDKARTLAWAKQIDRHPSISRDDMLDATQAFYDHPHIQPVSVGDVIAGARRIKRDRLDREENTARETRQAELSVKVGDDTQSLLDHVTTGRTNETHRLTTARQALQACHGREESKAAIREYLTARKEAGKR
jgi:hypothetical protein